MILRRFSQHLKDQNWLAVGLDIIVVIVGIFLGMQVTEWNEARKSRAEGYYYLDLLVQQLDHKTESRSKEITNSLERLTQIRHANRLLYADNWTTQEFEEFSATHSGVFYLSTEDQRPSALRQLIDNGKIDFLPSRLIQEKIFDLDRAYQEAIGQSDIVEQLVLNASETLIGEIHYGAPDDIQAITARPEVLLQSRKLKDAMYMVIVTNDIQLSSIRKLQETSSRLRDDLKIYLASQGHESQHKTR